MVTMKVIFFSYPLSFSLYVCALGCLHAVLELRVRMGAVNISFISNNFTEVHSMEGSISLFVHTVLAEELFSG